MYPLYPIVSPRAALITTPGKHQMHLQTTQTRRRLHNKKAMKDYGTKNKQALRWSTLDLLNEGHSGKELRTLLVMNGFDPEQFHYIDRWEEEWNKSFFRPTKSNQTPVG